MSACEVVLIEDHPLVVESVRGLVLREGFVLAGEASTVADAELLLSDTCGRSQRCPVAVVDVSLPDGSGLAIVEQWTPRGVRFVVLSGNVSARNVRESLDAGAHAFVAKAARPAFLAMALRKVAKGERFLCDAARLALAATPVEPALTPREAAVLRLIASGLSNKEVAQELGVAPRTIETHRERLLQKLGARNAADLTREAIRRGLVVVD